MDNTKRSMKEFTVYSMELIKATMTIQNLIPGSWIHMKHAEHTIADGHYFKDKVTFEYMAPAGAVLYLKVRSPGMQPFKISFAHLVPNEEHNICVINNKETCPHCGH